MKILAVDYNGLFARHALVKGGVDLDKATAGVVAAITTHRQNFDRVALCVDSGKSWRAALWQSYKANREDRGEVYREQLCATLDRLAKDGVCVFKAPALDAGYAEADDVIGSLCEWAKGQHDVTILSADKDLLQLVGPGVSYINLMSGSVYSKPEEVAAKMGVVPDRVPDLLALMGDSADNYKLVDGLGPKNAATLLEKCGHALAVFKTEHWDRLEDREYLGPALGQRFKAGVTPDRLRAALKVATVLRDVPCDFDALLADPVFEPLTEMPAPPVAPMAERFAEPKPKQTAIVKAEPVQVDRYRLNPFALEPRSARDAWDLAVSLFESRLYPQYANPQQVLAVMMEGRTLGLPGPTALKNAYVVSGRVGWSARLLRGLCLKHSQICEYFDLIESTPERATAKIKRVLRPELIVQTTRADAEKRGLVRGGSKWAQDPLSMCVADVERRGARLVFPDIVAGLWTPEELEAGADQRGVEMIEAA